MSRRLICILIICLLRVSAGSYNYFVLSLLPFQGQQEINDPSYESSSDDIMDLDEDFEELDLEPSSDENVRYLRVGYHSSGGFPGGFHGSDFGGSSSGQQLRVPRKPNMNSIPRGRAPKGWNQATRSGRHYHGFYLHTWCDCMWYNWFCFCSN